MQLLIFVCQIQKMVELCKNRVVLFDNMTKDPRVQAKQLEKLLDVVDNVCANNAETIFRSNVHSHKGKLFIFFVVAHVIFGTYLYISFVILRRRCIIEKGGACRHWILGRADIRVEEGDP